MALENLDLHVGSAAMNFDLSGKVPLLKRVTIYGVQFTYSIYEYEVPDKKPILIHNGLLGPGNSSEDVNLELKSGTLYVALVAEMGRSGGSHSTKVNFRLQ